MNCKPGDLAIIVSDLGWAGCSEYVGRIVKVVELDVPSFRHGAMWKVADAPPLLSAADSVLRPIRNPGEDARDETLIWKSVPSSTKEAA